MSGNNVLEFTDANFATEVVSSSTPVLVDFWAPWCGPCRMIAPVVEELAAEYAGRVKVGKLNVDDNPKVSTEYKIQAIPAIFLIKNGEVAEKIVGMTAKSALVAKLDSLL